MSTPEVLEWYYISTLVQFQIPVHRAIDAWLYCIMNVFNDGINLIKGQLEDHMISMHFQEVTT